MYHSLGTNVEKVSRFDRISQRGVHLPFRGVQPGARGVQIPEGVQSERLGRFDKLELCIFSTIKSVVFYISHHRVIAYRMKYRQQNETGDHHVSIPSY